MKPLSTFLVSLILLVPAWGATSFVAAGKFIHLRDIDEVGEQTDYHVRATAIEAIEIYGSQREIDGKIVRVSNVQIITRIIDTKHLYNDTVLASNKVYFIECADRAEAEKILAVIVAAISESENRNEEAGTGQPANPRRIEVKD